MAEKNGTHERPVGASLRLYDANLNRASEGLRVAEDVCRFHLDLPGLATELKELRHQLLAVPPGAGLSREDLLRARDIEGDVGRDSATPESSSEPVDLTETAYRNLRRGAEAIRVLEEVSRSQGGAPGALQELRYRVYSIEKAMLSLVDVTARRGELLEAARVCLLVTAEACRGGELTAVVRSCIDAGAGMIQLREKDLDDSELLESARVLREICSAGGALFVVNDRPDIALLSHADGVHLGQEDLSLSQARRIVGDNVLIGRSTHSLEQAREAAREGADYLGAGPVFETSTKDAGPLLGVDGLGAILEGVSLPVFAIGGLTGSNVSLVREAGGERIAVCSAVLDSSSPEKTVGGLCSVLA